MNLSHLLHPQKRQEYTSHLEAEGYSPASISRKDAAINQFQNWAQTTGQIPANEPAGSPEFIVSTPYKPPFWNRMSKKQWAISLASLTGLIAVIIFLLFLNIPGRLNLGSSARSSNPATAGPLVAGPTELTPWIIHFEGKVTSTKSLDKPLNQTSKFAFKLYPDATGGTPLWTSKEWEATPDKDGAIRVPLGDITRGDQQVPAEDFFLYENLYLGVSVNQGPELSGRFRVATAANAANSYLTNKYPAKTAATENSIPVINSDGVLMLAAASPKIAAENADFALEGQTITLQTPFASDGNITIAPDGAGSVNMRLSNADSQSLSISNANLEDGVLIQGQVGNDNTGYQFLEFTGGATSSAKFSVAATGDVFMSGGLRDDTLATFIPLSDINNTSLPGNATSILGALNLAYDTALSAGGTPAATPTPTATPTGSPSANAFSDGGTYLFPTGRESIRVYDSVGTNYLDVSDDGSNVIFDTNSGEFQFKDKVSIQASLNVGDIGALTTITGNSDLTINMSGGDVILSNGVTLNIGGSGSDVAYNLIGDTTSGASSTVGSDDDLYIEGNLEIDGTLDLDGAFDFDGTTFSAVASAGQANAIELIASSGGIDISTGSGTGDIDILSGDTINLKAVSGNLNFSSGTTTTQSGLVINTSGDLVSYGDLTLADGKVINVGGNGSDTAYSIIGDNTDNVSAAVNSDDDLYIEGNLEVDGTIYGNVSGSITPAGFTEGSVIFVDSGGSLSQNNSNFFWDNTNTRLGLSDTTPDDRLDIEGTSLGYNFLFGSSGITFSGSGTNNFVMKAGGAISLSGGTGQSTASGLTIDTNGDVTVSDNDLFVDVSAGYVGIGTTSPSYILDVNGDTRIAGDTILNSATPELYFTDSTSGHDDWEILVNSDNLDFWQRVNDTTWTDQITFASGGLVGIGDTSPDDKLDVEDANLGYNFLFGSGGITFSTSGTSGINVDTFGQLSLTTNQGAANALELISNAGGIDISTGSGTGDIDILSGDGLNLKAVGSDLTLSAGSPTYASGMVIDSGTGYIGIGTAAPTNLLVLSQNREANVTLQVAQVNTSYNAALRLDSTNTWQIISAGSLSGNDGGLGFYNGSYRVLIDSSGNVGVGDRTPEDKLDIEDTNLGYNFLFGSSGITFSTSGTSGINVDTYGQLSLTTNQGAANALELISNAGGIDISTGSATGDIDILSGDGLNLKAGTNGITLSTATFTLGSGFAINGTTGLSSFGSTATAGSADGAGDVYIERDLEVDGTIYGNLVGSLDLNFTQGSVLFADSGGAIAQDNSNFFWDDSANSLGLGDTSPDDKLDIEDANLGYNFLFGSGGITFSTATSDTIVMKSSADITLSAGNPSYASGLTVDSGTGYVGIGTASPASPLHVVSDEGIMVERNSAQGYITLYNNKTSPATGTNLGFVGFAGKDSTGDRTTFSSVKGVVTDNTNNSEDGSIVFQTMRDGSLNDRMWFSNTGDLGIGDDTPDGRLDVEDTAIGYNFLFGSNGVTFSTSGTSGINIDTFGSASITSNQGATNAVELIANAGGIDISTGSGTGDIDILSGDAINLSSVGGNITLSTPYNAGAGPEIVLQSGDGLNLKALNSDLTLSGGTNTYASGLVVDSSNGYIGIGTASPTTPLYLAGPGSSTTLFTVENSTAGVEIQGSGEGGFNVYTQGTMFFRIDSNNDTTNTYQFLNGAGTTVVTIDETGNLGLNDTTPDDRLDVEDSALGYNFLFGSNGVTFSTSGTSGINVDTKGQLALTSNQDAASAVLLESQSGGIDISTGSGTAGNDIDILSGSSINLVSNEAAADSIVIRAANPSGGIDLSTGYNAGAGGDIDILSGDQINLTTINGDISLSAGSPTTASGITLDSATGYVGIGDASPAGPLEINANLGGTNSFLVLTRNAQSWGLNLDNNYFNVYDSTNAKRPFIIETSTPDNTLYLDSTSTGRVGMGDSTPDDKLDIEDSALGYNFLFGSSGLTFSGAGTSDFALTSARDILFNDDNLTAAVPLSVADNALNASLTQGIIDAINDTYDAATGVAGGLWTRSGTSTYLTNTGDNVGIGSDITPDDKLDIENSSLGYNFLFGSNGITLSTSGTSGINIDTFGAYSVTGNQSAANAIELIAPNGGIDISTGSGTADIDILGGDAINITSQKAGTGIALSAPQGSISLSNGSSTGGVNLLSGQTITLNAEAGGITLSTGGNYGNSGGAINLKSGQSTANSIAIVSISGGIDISTGGDTQNIDILSGNDINITATDVLALATTGAAGQDITLINTGGSVIIRGTESVADAIFLDANDGAAGGIDIDTGTGGIDADGTGAISFNTSVGQANAIELIASAGGIDISTGSGTGDIDILGGDAINLSTPATGGNITLSTGYNAGVGPEIVLQSGDGLNLKAINSDLTLSAGTTTTTSGLVIDSATGNVGIGTASPSRTFAVNSGTYSYMSFMENGSEKLVIGSEFGFGSRTFIIYDTTSNSYPFVINSSGSVGVGDLSPDDRLDIENSTLGYNFLFGSNGVTFSTSGTSGINLDTFGSASITSNQGAANAVELIANAGGIDISTGSSTGDIDILGGDAINLSTPATAGNITLSTGYNAGAGPEIVLQSGDGLNLKALNSDLTLSAGTTTYASGLTVDSATGYVGIGDASPASLFTVGSGDPFQVDNSGNVTTSGDIAVNGDDITSDADLTINPSGGQLIVTGSINVGGVTNLSYNAFADSGTAGTAAGDNDVWIQDILEVDGTLDLDGAFDADGSTFDVLNTGAVSLQTSSGTANAIQLVATAGGIDISTGSGTQNIDILSGAGANLVAVSGGIDISTGGNGSAGGSIDILSGQGAATAITIVASAGGIDISTGSGTGDIDILSGDDITINALGGSLTLSTVTGLSTASGLAINSSGDVTMGNNDLYVDVSTGRVGIGTATPGYLFDIQSASSSIFYVTSEQITSAVPHQFLATGDVSMAYDLQFTNQTASYIKSLAPLYIEAGETFESNDLTLRSYNAGAIILDTEGDGATGSIQLLSQAGGIDISTGTGTAGNDIDILSGASINLTSKEAAADSLVIASTNGGIDISTGFNAGTRYDIDILGGGSVNISAVEGAADAITLVAPQGGIDISTGSGTGDIDILSGDAVNIKAVSGSITLSSGTNTTQSGLLVDSTGVYVGEFTAANSTALCWDNDGGSYITDCTGGPTSDYAEFYPTEPGIDYGEIVVTTSKTALVKHVTTSSDGNLLPTQTLPLSILAKATKPYQNNIIGITSSNYSDFSSTGHNSVDQKDNPLPVALSGRVPVKIDPDSPAIAIGDFVTSSANGMATKATQTGYVVGKALNSWEPGTDKSHLLIFINLTYYDPNVALSSLDEIQIASPSGPTLNTPYSILNTLTSQVINRLAAFSEAAIANLQAGKVDTNTLTANEITALKLQVAGTTTTDHLIAKSTTTNTLTANTLTATESAFGKLTTNSLTTNHLVANEASISALSADEISTSTVSARLAKLQELQAGTIKSQTIDNLESRLSSLEASNSSSPYTSYSIPYTESTPSASPNLSAFTQDLQVSNLDATFVNSDAGFFSEYLGVMGEANINQLNVENTIIIGQNLVLGANSLSLLNPGKLSLLGNLMTLESNGTVTINGDLAVSGALTTNSLTTNHLNVADATVSGSLSFRPSGFSQIMASIDASGSAKFQDVTAKTGAFDQLIIAQGESTPSAGFLSSTLKTNATVGVATLPKTQTELKIENSKIENSSLVYITPTSQTQNQVLYVKSKKSCPSVTSVTSLTCSPYFIVALDKPINTDVTFNWWIIN